MRPTTLVIGPGAIIKIDDAMFCVKKWQTADTVLVQNLYTLVQRDATLSEISQNLASQQSLPYTDLNEIDDEDWEVAVQRFRILEPVVWKLRRTREDVEKVASELLISVNTAYRWIKRIETTGTVSCLLRKVRNDKGEKKLDSDVESIVCSIISTEYLTKLKRSPAKALREIQRQCREKHLKLPCKGTLLRRIDEILPEQRALKRHGRNAALDYRPHRGSLPNVDYVHSIWQIDHTKVDIELVDEKDRISIGRPWITLAIDVYSRMVVGWYVSFDPPGALATGICIANAILPKDQVLAKLDVSYSWPCQGKPRVIQADNAREFRGNMLKRACDEHGIDLKFRKVKKPNYGAHIERMLGTLMNEIHGLEGTTFSNPQHKGEYDSEKNACMTLDEFERWLANLILGLYHHRKHTEIDCAPVKRYHDGIFGDDDTPGIGLLPIAADPERLRIDFLPFEERTIQPYGVVLDYIEYHDAVLDKWIGATDPATKRLARKFIFRRDPRNISFLYFWDPDVQLYFRIPYRHTERPAISLWELKRVQTYLNEQGKKDIDEDMIFGALNAMRKIEETSKELTRKQRREQERRTRHERAVPSTIAPDVPSQVSNIEIDVRPKDKPARPLMQFDPTTIMPFEEIEPM